MEMNSNNTQKTVSSTGNVLFEFAEMPLGVMNAPSAFQRVVDNILLGIQNATC